MVEIKIRTPEKNDPQGHTMCDIQFMGGIDQMASLMVELEHAVRKTLLTLHNGDDEILWMFAHGLTHYDKEDE